MALGSLPPDVCRRLIMSVGTHHGERLLSPVEVALAFRAAVDSGASVRECAEATSVNDAMVGRFLSLLHMPVDVRHVVDWGRSKTTVAFSAAFELSRLSNAGDIRAGVEAVLLHGLSSTETRQLVQSKKRSPRSFEECVRAVLKMRPTVEVRHLFVGVVSDERARATLATMTQQERSKVLAALLAGPVAHLQCSGRLGSDRITLVGGHELGVAVNEGSDKLEAMLNQLLEKALGQ